MSFKLRHIVFSLLLLLGPTCVLAAPMQAAAAPLRAGFFPAAAEIGQQIQELVTGDPKGDIEPQETFGTRALGLMLSTAKLIGTEGANFISNFAALPQLSTWFQKQFTDPNFQVIWLETGRLLLLVVGSAFAAGWLADLILLPLRRRIYNKDFRSAWSKALGVFSWLGLSLVPVILFIVTALYVIDVSDPLKLTRFLVMTVIYALALLRLVRVLLRFLLAPRVPSLRFVPLSTEKAVYIQTWVTWFSAVMLLRFFIVDMAKVLKVPPAAISGFGSLVALIIVAMTIVVIMQCRSYVSTFLRGDLSAARANNSLTDNLRLWVARTWHVLAISYLVVGYFVTMLGASGGFAQMQQGTVGTLLVLLLMRLSFYLAAKLTYKKTLEGEATSGIYRPVLRVFIKIVTWVVGLVGILASWGVDVEALLLSAWGQRVLGSAFSITSTLMIVVLVYELIHAAIERRLNRRDAQGRLIQANARSRTLLPMIRNAAIIILAIIVGMVTLSELGINIAPLLAGAGVLGVAIGFGSQTLVKDFLTGLFIILEDNIAVGDSVAIGANKGVVEGMTIRTLRLRDVNGALHILPFSEITRIVNESKYFSFAVMDIGVSYDSDLDKVMNVIKEVGEELRQDEAFKSMILEPLEMLGVETLGDSSITIRSRIKTEGGKHADVRRAFLLRIKQRFDHEQIEIPFPTVVQVRKEHPVG